MAEYIEREKAIFPLYRWRNIIKNTYGENDEYVKCLNEAIDKINDIPAADVAPVRRGKWITHGLGMCEYRCPFCGKMIFADDSNERNYCPCCGAKMEEE